MYLANPSKAQYYGGLTAFGDGANATYNGLLVSIQHRFTSNFTVLANHTWSHCLSENEVALNGGGSARIRSTGARSTATVFPGASTFST